MFRDLFRIRFHKNDWPENHSQRQQDKCPDQTLLEDIVHLRTLMLASVLVEQRQYRCHGMK